MAEEAKSGSREASSTGDDENASGSEGGQRDERAPEGERASHEPQRPSGTGEARDEQQISAPSLGPNTVIEREPVEERLARHDQSEVDAMGLDKRRAVVGEKVGPSKTRQLVVYLGFLAVMVALVVGGLLLVKNLDTSVGKDVPKSAPWAKSDKQIKPEPIQ